MMSKLHSLQSAPAFLQVFLHVNSLQDILCRLNTPQGEIFDSPAAHLEHAPALYHY